MSILRKSTGEVKKIMLDSTDYIVVRADISKREFNQIAGAMPRTPKDGEEISLTEATSFQGFLFDLLVLEWSLAEGKPTLDDYGSLSAAAANAVDTAVSEHFEGIIPSSAEGK